MAITEQDILLVLKEIQLPNSEGNLVDSGRLSPIIKDKQGRIIFSISIRPEEASRMEIIRQAAEEAVRKRTGETNILVSLTAERVKNQATQPASQGKNAKKLPNIKHVIAVASGKGGVGKSTLAANLAVSFAGQGLKTGLLDADIYGPSVPMLFGAKERPHMRDDQKIEPVKAWNITLMSIGFMVKDNDAIIWRGPMVMSAITQLLNDVDWGELDILVIDMPPGTGDVQITICQNVIMSGAVIVSTPQDLALIDARRAAAMFEKTGIPVIGFIENMSAFLCPHCGKESHIFGHGGAKTEAERLHIPFLGEIPLAMTIRELSDAGHPVAAPDSDAEISRAYHAVAEKIKTKLFG